MNTSKSPFVKLEIGFCFQNESECYAEGYREKAEVTKDPQEKVLLFKKADILEAELNPTQEELYQFMSAINYSNDPTCEVLHEARYIELSKLMLSGTVYRPKLFMKGGKTCLSFVYEFDEEEMDDTFDDLREMVMFADDPFMEAAVGSELRYPSKNDPMDLLGTISMFLMDAEYVTDATGETETPDIEDVLSPMCLVPIEEESDEDEVDLDDVEPAKKKFKWCKMFPKPFRTAFKHLKATF